MFRSLYTDLRAVAEVVLRRVPLGQTVFPTELIHEAYLRLSRGMGGRWESDAHFLNAAGQAMRCYLTDRARRRMAAKRGGGGERVPLDDRVSVLVPDEHLLEVHEALAGLEGVDPRAARLVELTFFLGLSQAEAAGAVGVTDRTARRDLLFARAWLARALGASALPHTPVA